MNKEKYTVTQKLTKEQYEYYSGTPEYNLDNIVKTELLKELCGKINFDTPYHILATKNYVEEKRFDFEGKYRIMWDYKIELEPVDDCGLINHILNMCESQTEEELVSNYHKIMKILNMKFDQVLDYIKNNEKIELPGWNFKSVEE